MFRNTAGTSLIVLILCVPRLSVESAPNATESAPGEKQSAASTPPVPTSNAGMQDSTGGVSANREQEHGKDNANSGKLVTDFARKARVSETPIAQIVSQALMIIADRMRETAREQQAWAGEREADADDLPIQLAQGRAIDAGRREVGTASVTQLDELLDQARKGNEALMRIAAQNTAIRESADNLQTLGWALLFGTLAVATGGVLLGVLVMRTSRNAFLHESIPVPLATPTPPKAPQPPSTPGKVHSPGVPTRSVTISGPSAQVQHARQKVQPVTTIQPVRPSAQPLADADTDLGDFLQSQKLDRSLTVKPVRVGGPWRMGFATCTGNVRKQNEDYVWGFEIAGLDVLIVADGCGGTPHGQRAARLAVLAASAALIRDFNNGWWHGQSLRKAALDALNEAKHTLAREGDKLNVQDIGEGLRTTLILVIADRREYGFAYAGDGGLIVLRSSGKEDRLLKPQRAHGFANVLATSLGPRSQGQAFIGSAERRPGDLLIVGTDGVMDRVPDSFSKDVLRACIIHSGDLQKVAKQVLDELASAKDEQGYIADDNMSLGLLGFGEGPQLVDGFWNDPIETPKSGPGHKAAQDGLGNTKDKPVEKEVTVP